MKTNSVIVSQLSELAAVRQKADDLQASINEQRNKDLREIHVSYGYASPAEFMAGYRAANNGVAMPTTRKVAGGRKAKANGAQKDRKPRTTITPERRKEIKDFFKSGKSTIDAVNKFDISIATAQIIKDEAGMVTHRK